MSPQLFGHPFSSYTWKVLIALWADETPFKFRMVGPDHPENGDELRRRWPFGQFPLLVDGDRSVVESTCIIEHLQAHHPGPNRWIPDGELGRRVRFLDRVFDLRVMANMQAVMFDALRPAEQSRVRIPSPAPNHRSICRGLGSSRLRAAVPFRAVGSTWGPRAGKSCGVAALYCDTKAPPACEPSGAVALRRKQARRLGLVHRSRTVNRS